MSTRKATLSNQSGRSISGKAKSATRSTNGAPRPTAEVRTANNVLTFIERQLASLALTPRVTSTSLFVSLVHNKHGWKVKAFQASRDLRTR